MTLRHLRIFVAVYQERSITRAADRLHLAQPSVSLAIKELEDNYSIRLFERYSRRIYITEQGEQLYNYALHIISLFDEMEEKIPAWKQAGTLRIGSSVTIGNFLLPTLIQKFQEEAPAVRPQVTINNSGFIEEAVLNNQLDFALVEGYFSGGDYDYQIYSTEKYIPVAGAAYQLQASSRGKKLLRTEDLLSEPILIREQGSGTREVLERILEGKNLAVRDFRKIHEINNLQVMKYLIREGRGITFLYEAAVRQEIEQGILREIRLKDFSVEHDFYFVWRKGSIYGSEYKEIFKQLKGEEYDGKETRE